MAECVVVPYCYEPLRRQVRREPEDDPDPNDPVPDRPTGNVENWCTCNRCGAMPTERENICCHSYKKVRDLFLPGQECITEHPGFEGNCLNRWVLEASVYEFVEVEGLQGDDDPLHRLMRHLAYRRFVRWVFGRLGRHNRRVMPACAVKSIRSQFPLGFQMGFRNSVY